MEQPYLGDLLTMVVINHLLTGMILQVGDEKLPSYIGIIITGQIITTSAEVTLNGGLIRELPQNPLNSG